MSESPVRATSDQSEPCAAAVWDADADHPAGDPWIWSHRNVLAQTAEAPALAWSRIVAMALALAIHLAMLLQVTLPPTALPSAATNDPGGPATVMDSPPDGLWLVFVEPAVTAGTGDVAVDADVPPASPSHAVQPAPDAPVAPPVPPAMGPMSEPRAVASPAPVEPRDAVVLPSVVDVSAPAARLFRADGSVALPAAVIADLRAVESEERKFDYMTPGLAGAASAFRPEPTLPYTPTRFDADWKPVRTLGEDVIIPISEMLTYENKRKSFRCSLIPPGCAWGRVDAGHELDDPTTLNPIEDAQCRRLWDAIVAAIDEGESLKLRSRFDSECRKPLERDGAPPAPRVAEPAPG